MGPADSMLIKRAEQSELLRHQAGAMFKVFEDAEIMSSYKGIHLWRLPTLPSKLHFPVYEREEQYHSSAFLL